MSLHPDPSLAELTDFSPAQLESLTRSVELKQQKLEDDIRQYISQKQDELRKHEQELIEQYRSMNRAESSRGTHGPVSTTAPVMDADISPTALSLSSPSTVDQPADSKLGPGEAAKRTKHTRVHKREKELCGLVTPYFLPLLDASETSPTKKRKDKRRHREDKVESAGDSSPQSEQGSPSRDAEKGKETRRSRSRHKEEKMESGEAIMASSETKSHEKKEEKKPKRSTTKKSALKHNNTPRPRRKRVSLVIDDQIVLPADNIVDASAVTSPSETATSSASNSTTSLEDMIDPRLVTRIDTPVHHEPVHHSLPLRMSLPSTSPTKHTGHTLSESPPSLEYEPLQTTSDSNRTLEYELPQTKTGTYLDPSPPNTDLEIPEYASTTPIYANAPELADRTEEEFSTYVGGIDGSGADDVDQAGSYGYPSSLGASYLESYMKSRPLSVRLAAAEKGELGEREKRELIKSDKAKEEDVDLEFGRVEDMDDMDVIGSMEV
ncbi:hypothetical protein CC78DRAFT_507762 [Lojkania enalia]|uniref:Tymo-45kd-70kd multi-domain protein n=1 Tax=Lojkania enalia TaxID=147567 RepID=A0A9P4NBD6_9PLEO|nr:hypothetical protein CC78DRAFT_507762 [Didymosphaeria enalia]